MIAKDEPVDIPAVASIPVIDFTSWTDIEASSKERVKVASDLINACKEVGFVYIVNHGISTELLDEAFAVSKQLFDLPHDKKMLAPHPPTPEWHRGYSPPGLEKVSQVNAGEPEDGKTSKQLRTVKDCKVSVIHICFLPARHKSVPL